MIFWFDHLRQIYEELFVNKLAKAQKMLKPSGTLGFKKFGPDKFWVKKVWAQNIEKVEEKMRKLKKN